MRQEDAHEFIRYLADSLQRSCLQGYETLNHATKETTMVHAIFGGVLRSQVKCSECQHPSRTYDAFLDLSLEIAHCSSIEQALAAFSKTEMLDKARNKKIHVCYAMIYFQN